MSRPRDVKRFWPLAALVVIVQIWAAHALAFFAHEYGHSFTAWALGWKADPLILNFGDLSWPNLLAMLKIDERVDYGPIFASGHGAQAALIAAAGVLANFVLYPIAVIGFLLARKTRPALAMFFYWLCVMCVGNFLDYVPTRCFSPEDDMHTLELGLGWPPALVVLTLGLPFLLGGIHFFARLWPAARSVSAPLGIGFQRTVLSITTFLIFVFFSMAGLEPGEGEIARKISLACMFGFFPVATFIFWPRDAIQTKATRARLRNREKRG